MNQMAQFESIRVDEIPSGANLQSFLAKKLLPMTGLPANSLSILSEFV